MKERVGVARRLGRRGHALARHLPLHRHQDPAPPRRARRPAIRLHHPRHRRPAPPDEAGHRGRGHRREALAGAPARRHHRRLEEPRPRRPTRCRPGEAAAFANGKGGELYAAYQERLKTLNAADFGDLLLECLRLLREQPGRPAATTRTASATCWSTSTRTPTSPSISGCGCSRRRARTSAASATTTSRSMAGAAPRSTTSCASSTTFPARRSIRLERNYRSTGHILAAASRLIANNEGRLGKTLRTEDEPGEKVTITGAWDSRGGGAPHRRGDRGAAGQGAFASPRSPSWCASRPRCARSRTGSSRSACPTASSAARASTSGPKSATPSPICAASPTRRRPRLRAHRQRAEARPRRRDARTCCTATPARAACR